MKLAVLSGKGGTGKTFVSVNLAAAAKNATYMDCDVEEPNGRLFLKPTKVTSASVDTMLVTSRILRTFAGSRASSGSCQMIFPDSPSQSTMQVAKQPPPLAAA